VNQLIKVDLKYGLGSSFITKITHMEHEEIFGSSKWKAQLPPRLEGDSHKHVHLHVNTQIGKSLVQIKQLLNNNDPYEYMDNIDGGVEVLEDQCKN
jgi:hypothetical protein